MTVSYANPELSIDNMTLQHMIDFDAEFSKKVIEEIELDVQIPPTTTNPPFASPKSRSGHFRECRGIQRLSAPRRTRLEGPSARPLE
ncbi:hypothetical protein K523DRAFT_140723 [Schizophyllum commune Tattone D]|nr:hypothetical protein K523DRAFT_140723 [Schizophyllum commune Tattone D]